MTARGMSKVDSNEVLLLWRALLWFRRGPKPICGIRNAHQDSPCPFFDACPRWNDPENFQVTVDHDTATAERRQRHWPCSRLLELLGPDITRIGR